MAASPSNVIALDREFDKFAGAIVFWRVNTETNIDDLKRAWVNAGLDKVHPIPEPPTPTVALSRAMTIAAAHGIDIEIHQVSATSAA